MLISLRLLIYFVIELEIIQRFKCCLNYFKNIWSYRIWFNSFLSATLKLEFCLGGSWFECLLRFCPEQNFCINKVDGCGISIECVSSSCILFFVPDQMIRYCFLFCLSLYVSVVKFNLHFTFLNGKR